MYTVQKAVDCLLTLFPFESEYYKGLDLKVHFVGHPFADQIPLEINTKKAKLDLELDPDEPVIAVLPGSRDRELESLGEDFLKAASLCHQKNPAIQIIVPVVSESHKNIIKKKSEKTNLPVTIITQNARLALAACDVALVKAGTGTLEGLLHKKLMVTAYRLRPLMFWIAKAMVNIKFISMANWLAGEEIAPEFVQTFTPEQLANALMDRLNNPNDYQWALEKSQQVHLGLQSGAGEKGAKVLLELLGENACAKSS